MPEVTTGVETLSSPAGIDPELGYDPLHPAVATERFVYPSQQEDGPDEVKVESAGVDENGAQKVKVKGGSYTFGALRDALDLLEGSLVSTSHLRADEADEPEPAPAKAAAKKT